MQDTANTEVHSVCEINDAQLDDISGGPHFRNFHGAAYDFAAAPRGDSANEGSGHHMQVVWAED